MKYKEIEYKNKKLTRINRKKAVNILQHPKKYQGLTVYFLPVNANPESPWINGFEYLTMNYNSMDPVDNMHYINVYIYHHCVDDLGSYLKFYIDNKLAESEVK